ncbi:MAG: ribosome biogenesis GTPase YlqF [Betaproteobacteria bacterium HGW-Betaproteobacteria-11]|nr:MAG: ribosome biogenesis GTPase YlqF [Betaproteobacteria bacterium HGW-Betaproteobacteria-11]
MSINWFPGHMTSARRKAAETMALIDVVIEVCDARLPEASSNPLIQSLRLARQRPCLKLLNKSDLADPKVTAAWIDFYNRQPGVKAMAIAVRNPGEAARIPALCQSLAPHRNDGIKPLRMLVMGIPNVGKSTLINALVKRRVAAVGDEPAVTKSQMTLDLGGHTTITDTPGLMWPKIEFESDGFMLAAAHAIGRNAVIDSEVAAFLATLLLDRYPSCINQRYDFTTDGLDGIGVVEAVAKKRGCLQKTRHGNFPDLEKAAMILLTDFRSGKLGRISLETPESRAAMRATRKPSAPAVDAADATSS